MFYLINEMYFWLYCIDQKIHYKGVVVWSLLEAQKCSQDNPWRCLFTRAASITIICDYSFPTHTMTFSWNTSVFTLTDRVVIVGISAVQRLASVKSVSRFFLCTRLFELVFIEYTDKIKPPKLCHKTKIDPDWLKKTKFFAF